MSKKHIVVITGLAGAGKSTAARALEDLGFFVVDNLPPQLIETLVALSDSSGGELWRMAFVIDAREAKFLKDFGPTWERLKALGHEVTLLFLDASDDSLLTRFKETRRRHPLAGDDGVREGIAKERELLEEMQQRADDIIDTSDLSVHDLKRLISERFEAAELEQRRVTVMSFGFKHGLPPELDLCFDVRFLQNPYFVDALRPLPGTDPKVAAYVMEQPNARAFLEKAEEMLCFLLPRFAQEGKAYITAAIGCTGGKHRSVAIAEALAQRMKARGLDVRVVHRDIGKP